jgi:two-component system, NarL family, sensor kinase
MSIRRPVVQFALAGLAVVAVFLAGSLVVLQRIGQSEAARDARQFAVLSGQGIVEPALRDGVLSGDEETIAGLDQLVQERVLGERVVRVKVWTRGGRVVYSDEPRLIGTEFPLDDSKLEVLETGAARSELAELSGPENRFEQGFGDLYEVYLPVRTPNGTPLLFETYQRASAVEATGRRIWVPFAVLVLVCLLLLWLVQIPLAHRLARRLERSQHEREELLERSLEASADERRRIAADLHDGVVQDLAGISYSLSAAAETADSHPPEETRAVVQEAASGTRETIRELRSLLVEIHPPNLRAAGLDAALRDAVSRLSASGVDVTLDVVDERLPEDTEVLFYRAASEALRNVERHANASHVRIGVFSANGTARLEVVDDGVGFTPEQCDASRAEGHVGLSLLEELATRAGGRLDVASRPGDGTSLVLEVPVS